MHLLVRVQRPLQRDQHSAGAIPKLLAQGLELHCAVDDLDLDQLNTLFMKVGFPRRHKEKLAKALQHTLSLIWLRERQSKQLVAFAKATGDNVFNAVIWDVVVDPGFQGSGLGRVVMERLMFELVRRGISNIALYAEPTVVNFYKPMGFLLSPDGIRAMAYSRRRKEGTRPLYHYYSNRKGY